MTRQKTRPEPRTEAEAMLRGLFDDLAMDRGKGTGLVAFCEHAGIDLLRRPAPQWWPAFQAHYLGEDGAIDAGRVSRDLATWGPIASRVMELRLDRQGCHA